MRLYKVTENLKIKNLQTARYNLVKELKETYPINDLFRAKIKNYKTYASIFQIV